MHARGKKRKEKRKKEALKNLASSILLGIYMFYGNEAVIIYYYAAAIFSVPFMILQNSVAPVNCCLPSAWVLMFTIFP